MSYKVEVDFILKDLVTPELLAMAKAMTQMQKELDQVINQMKSLTGELGTLGGEFKNLRSGAQSGTSAMTKLGNEAEKAGAKLAKAGQHMSAFHKASKAIAANMSFSAGGVVGSLAAGAAMSGFPEVGAAIAGMGLVAGKAAPGAKEYQTTLNRMKMMNYSDAEIKALKRQADIVAAKYPQYSPQQALEIGIEGRSMLGKGSGVEVANALPALAQGGLVLDGISAATGVKFDRKHELNSLLRIAERKAMTKDANQILQAIDPTLRGALASGGKLMPHVMASAYQRMPAALVGIDPAQEYAFQEVLQGQLSKGGGSGGTGGVAKFSAMNQIFQNGRMNKAFSQELKNLGILSGDMTPDPKNGTLSTQINPGKQMVGYREYQKDQFDWFQKYMKPALEKTITSIFPSMPKGTKWESLSVGQQKEVMTRDLSGAKQTAFSGMEDYLLRQNAQRVYRNRAATAAVDPQLAAVQSMQTMDGQWKAINTQFETFGSIFGRNTKLMNLFIDSLKIMADSMSEINQFLLTFDKRFPHIAKMLDGLADDLDKLLKMSSPFIAKGTTAGAKGLGLVAETYLGGNAAMKTLAPVLKPIGDLGNAVMKAGGSAGGALTGAVSKAADSVAHPPITITMGDFHFDLSGLNPTDPASLKKMGDAVGRTIRDAASTALNTISGSGGHLHAPMAIAGRPG